MYIHCNYIFNSTSLPCSNRQMNFTAIVKWNNLIGFNWGCQNTRKQ